MDRNPGSCIDDLDLPILRCPPETTLKRLSKYLVGFLSRVALKPLNIVAEEHGVKPFREVRDLWKRFYNRKQLKKVSQRM
jgi:hypothetical protein